MEGHQARWEEGQASDPDVVTEYHTWMRGVDVFSKREFYSRIACRARRW
jgi:hypothetical protein